MVAADSNRPEGHFAPGVVCTEQGRYAEALEAFRQHGGVLRTGEARTLGIHPRTL